MTLAPSFFKSKLFFRFFVKFFLSEINFLSFLLKIFGDQCLSFKISKKLVFFIDFKFSLISGLNFSQQEA